VSPVSSLAAALVAATPTPFPAYEGDVNLITPGVVGFFMIFLVAVATVFLILDMNRRIRRTRYRGEVREQLEAERAAAESAAAAKSATPADGPADERS
jgi:hypothetical protein